VIAEQLSTRSTDVTKQNCWSGIPATQNRSQPRGRVGQTYAYPGGGRKLYEMGALFAGARRPAQARIDLMLALGAGYGPDALRALFDG
jgi:L-asparaginase